MQKSIIAASLIDGSSIKFLSNTMESLPSPKALLNSNSMRKYFIDGQMKFITLLFTKLFPLFLVLLMKKWKIEQYQVSAMATKSYCTYCTYLL